MLEEVWARPCILRRFRAVAYREGRIACVCVCVALAVPSTPTLDVFFATWAPGRLDDFPGAGFSSWVVF